MYGDSTSPSTSWRGDRRAPPSESRPARRHQAAPRTGGAAVPTLHAGRGRAEHRVGVQQVQHHADRLAARHDRGHQTAAACPAGPPRSGWRPRNRARWERRQSSSEHAVLDCRHRARSRDDDGGGGRRGRRSPGAAHCATSRAASSPGRTTIRDQLETCHDSLESGGRDDPWAARRRSRPSLDRALRRPTSAEPSRTSKSRSPPSSAAAASLVSSSIRASENDTNRSRSGRAPRPPVLRPSTPLARRRPGEGATAPRES